MTCSMLMIHFLLKYMTDVYQLIWSKSNAIGAQYGLALNWKKIEALPVRSNPSLKGPDGTEIELKDAILYLGAMISGNGRITSELNRRIGMASADFATLSRIWNHSNLTRLDKVKIYQVLIFNKLL